MREKAGARREAESEANREHRVSAMRERARARREAEE